MDKNFWKTKKLSEFSEEEWEAVCLQCGKCCLFKEKTGDKVCFTNMVCDNYDLTTGKCRCYATRLSPDCGKVDLQLLRIVPELLPETCAYRLLFAGKELPSYHPLVSGHANSVHEAGETLLELPDIHTQADVRRFGEELRAYAQHNDLCDDFPEELYRKVAHYRKQIVAVYQIPS